MIVTVWFCTAYTFLNGCEEGEEENVEEEKGEEYVTTTMSDTQRLK